MARQPQRYGQRMSVVGGTAPRRVAARIETVVNALVAAPDAAAATLLFPKIQNLDELVAVATALGSTPAWSLTRSLITNTRAGDVVAFRLAREIPFPPGGTVPSEALFLGPFDPFPETRRAPVVALELFVGAPLLQDPKTRKPTTKANVAHVDLSLPTQAAFDNTWRNSERGRLASLGDQDDPRAKARVAFVVPMDVALSIGCWP